MLDDDSVLVKSTRGKRWKKALLDLALSSQTIQVRRSTSTGCPSTTYSKDGINGPSRAQ